MQHCPQCQVEYREGFAECTDCQVPLVPGPRPEAPPVDHGLHLVTVLEVGDSLTLTLAKSALDDAGIEYTVTGDDPVSSSLPGLFGAGAAPLIDCACAIQVSRESEAMAREILEPFQGPVSPVPDGEEPPESDAAQA